MTVRRRRSRDGARRFPGRAQGFDAGLRGCADAWILGDDRYGTINRA
jgi:hypothetical protein